jgi:hypothetical protein
MTGWPVVSLCQMAAVRARATGDGTATASGPPDGRLTVGQVAAVVAVRASRRYRAGGLVYQA